MLRCLCYLDAGTTWERIFASCLTQVNSIDMVELSPQYGNDSEVVFIAGNSNGNPAIWKSTDNGQKFRCRGTYDPDSGDAFPIYAWAVVNDTTVFIGSYDGSDGLVYQTNDSGFSYSSGAKAGSQAPTSLVLSPNYEQDGTLLISNSDSWVYWSSDNGSSFEPLPPDATSAPLTGAITVAFDPDFGSNKTVYAVSDSADEGVYRFTIGTDTEWESIDSNLPGGSTLNQVIVSAGGTLYAANSQTDSGIERCLNPTYSLGPTFETVTRGLSDNATLSGLWQDDDRLWSTDTNHAKLMTFLDNLTSPVALTSPPDAAAGIGTIINYAISHVSLDWEATESATSYQWQLDYDTDFSSVPSEFEDNTKASSVHLPSLEPAATYYWRVRVSEPVLSPWSAKWSFTTILDTETAVLKLESPKAGAIGMPVRPLFQWSAVPGADVYELLVSTDVQFANPSIVKAGAYALPATAWQGDISLGYDATYYWKVRAVSTNSYSAWSAAGTFTTEAMPISPAPTPASSPTLILPVPAPQTLTPSVSPTAPPTLPPVPPTPTQIPTTPDWVIYLVGALLLTIILLVITLFVLVIGVRRA